MGNLGTQNFLSRINRDGESHESKIRLACSENIKKARGPGALVNRQKEL